MTLTKLWTKTKFLQNNWRAYIHKASPHLSLALFAPLTGLWDRWQLSCCGFTPARINNCMNFKQFLEMPIGNAELIGKGWGDFPQNKSMNQNWDKGSHNILMRSADQRFEKLRNAWSKVSQTFDMYFLKDKGTRSSFLQGEVDESYLKKLGVDIPINRDNITVIFSNNLGGDRVPMTPWVVGHRFGHGVFQLDTFQRFVQHVERDFREILETVYGREKQGGVYGYDAEHDRLMKQIMMSFGTMRSARTKNLSNYREFIFELFGQYIIAGEIKFRSEIPRSLTTRYAWGNPVSGASSKIHNDEPMMDHIKDQMESNAHYYGVECDRILNDCIGRIFVV